MDRTTDRSGKVAAISAASVAAAAGAGYVFYRSIPALMAAVMKAQMNPPDENLGQLIPEKGAPSYEDIAAMGMVRGKSALVVGGTRGVGYGTALALARSGASTVTVVGRSEASGSKAVSSIRAELADASSPFSDTKVTFLRGDIGTVASTRDLLQNIRSGGVRYDYLIVTAAIFPQPKKRNPNPLNDDGVEKSFGIAVVGRFLLYRGAHAFMRKPDTDALESPMILNVLAAGGDMGVQFSRKMVRSLASFHLHNIANFAIGNELMLHEMVRKEKGNSDGTRFGIPIVTTHPGFLKTDLHRGQGPLMDFFEGIMVHFMGRTEEVCGRREVSLLCAIGSKPKTSARSLLTIIDHLGYGRLVGSGMEQDLKDHGDWLWNLLLLMEGGGDLKKYKD